jgi:hypothetical protein
VWQFGTGNKKYRRRARVYSEWENEVDLPLQLPELWALEIRILATCPSQFAKAGSAATLSQQEKKNSADVQRSGFALRGDALSASWSHIFELQLRRMHLRHRPQRGPPAALPGLFKGHGREGATHHAVSQAGRQSDARNFS